MRNTILFVAALIAAVTSFSAAGQSVSFDQLTKLSLSERSIVRLMPDGEHLLAVAKTTDAEHPFAYVLTDLGGENQNTLFKSAIDFDDIISFTVGQGFVSPSGKYMALLTTHNGKGYRQLRNDPNKGKPITVICDSEGKVLHKLTGEIGLTVGAVFADDNTVYYCDFADPDGAGRDNMKSAIRRFDLTTGKSDTVATFDQAIVTCPQLSPDRKHIAFLHAIIKGPDRMAIGVLDIPAGDSHLSPGNMRMDDAYYDDAIWLTWSADSRTVYASARVEDSSNRRLVAFHPDAEGEQRLVHLMPTTAGTAPAPADAMAEQIRDARIAQLILKLGDDDYHTRVAAQKELIEIGRPALEAATKAKTSSDAEVAERAGQIVDAITGQGNGDQRGPRYITLTSLGPNLLNVADMSAKQSFTMDTKTQKLTPLDPPYLVVDRQGQTVLLHDLAKDALYTGKLTLKP